MRRIAGWLVVIAVVAAVPANAQDVETERLRGQSLTAALASGTFVVVRMKDGTQFKGTFVQSLPDRVVVKPKTRIPGPDREVPFSDLQSIQPARPGMSPGMKVAIGAAVGVGATFILVLLAVSGSQ